MLWRLVVPHAGLDTPVHSGSFWYAAAAVVLFRAAGCLGVWKGLRGQAPAMAVGFGYALALTVCLVLAPQGEKVFIYFQF